MPARKPNRWHPVMLPDDYLRKMKQALGEVEARIEAETKYEPVVRPGPVRRATSESYYVPFPDDDPPPHDEDTQPIDIQQQRS